CTRVVRDGADVAGRIEGSCVHVAGLHTNDARAVQIRQGTGAHAALLVDGHAHGALAAQTEQPQTLDQRWMTLLADHHLDRRSSEETLTLHVPSCTLQDGMPRGGERGEVRHRCSCDESSATTCGQCECIHQPTE